jgi:hypothetical protein
LTRRITIIGNTILGFWRDWLQHAKDGTYSIHYPQYTSDTADLSEMRQELTTPVVALDNVVQIPDIRKLDILNRRMIVSRKRTRNLFDLTTLWKKLVLSNMEQQVLPDNYDLASQNVAGTNSDMDIDSHDDSSSSDSNEDPFVTLLRNQGAVF